MKLTALFVEGHPDSREVLTFYLNCAGIEVTALGTLDEARTLLRQDHQFDLYVLDNHPQNTSGLDFCREIHHSNAKVPIFIYSGQAYPSDVQQGIKASVTDYILKPTHPAIVLDAIEKAFGCTFPVLGTQSALIAA